MTTLSFPKIYTDERVAKMLLGKARKAHPDAKLDLCRQGNGWQIATPKEEVVPALVPIPGPTIEGNGQIIMGFDLGTKDGTAIAKVDGVDLVTSELKKVLHTDIFPEQQKAVITFPLVKDHPKTLVVLHEGKEVWLDKCRLHGVNILGGGWVTVGMDLKYAKRRKFVDLKAA